MPQLFCQKNDDRLTRIANVSADKPGIYDLCLLWQLYRSAGFKNTIGPCPQEEVNIIEMFCDIGVIGKDGIALEDPEAKVTVRPSRTVFLKVL